MGKVVATALALACSVAASTVTRADGDDRASDRGNDPSTLEGDVRASSYVVGPGDRMRIVLWGLHELEQEIEVTAEGRLFVPRAGMFEAGGQTLSQLRGRVEARLRSIYPGLGSSLTLTRPRTFLVHVTGAVVRPGTYEASPLTRVSAMLPKAGGVLPTGSRRRVEIHRRGVDEPLRADLTRFSLFGQIDQDPQVLDGDTLYVPPRALTVEVTGAVRRPGAYELVAARTVGELLELAGGFDTGASRARPLRVTSRAAGDRVEVRSVSLSSAPAVALADGDIVHVPELAEQRPTVLVQGAVVGPPKDGSVAVGGNVQLLGTVPATQAGDEARPDAPHEISVVLPFVEHEGVRDLVAQAGGLEPWADLRNAYLARRDQKGATYHLPVDLASLQTGVADDVPVSAGDTLVIPARRQQVLVAGAVQRPGYYAYSGDLKPRDYLNLAGGPTRSGDSDGARVLQNGNSRSLEKVSALEPGDVITVPERRFTTAEWTSMALILGNIAIGAAALGVAAAHQ
ncbi:MAG TPA: SLBB domain-containing protein [Polyangia bacterium]